MKSPSGGPDDSPGKDNTFMTKVEVGGAKTSKNSLVSLPRLDKPFAANHEILKNSSLVSISSSATNPKIQLSTLEQL